MALIYSVHPRDGRAGLVDWQGGIGAHKCKYALQECIERAHGHKTA